MKVFHKILSLIIVCLLIFSLTSCSNSEVEDARLRMREQNFIVEGISVNYEDNYINAKNFSEKCFLILESPLDDFLNYMYDNFSILNSFYSQEVDLYTTLVSIRSAVEDMFNSDEEFKEFKYDYFYFMTESGDIEEFIELYVGSQVYYWELNWNNGKIISESVRRVA